MKHKSLFALLSATIFSTFVQAENLKVAVDISSAPFVYQNDQGDFIGFEAELLAEIAKLQGFSFDYVPAIFPAVLAQLDNKEIDLIGHAFISEQRREQYDFSDPYYIDHLQFVKLTDNSATDPVADGTRIAVLSNSPIAVEFSKINQDFPKVEAILSKSAFLAFKSLFMKQSDMMIAPSSEISYYTNNWKQYQYQRFDIPASYQQGIEVAFLIRKGNDELRQKINEGLQKTKENGTYERLKAKYQL